MNFLTDDLFDYLVSDCLQTLWICICVMIYLALIWQLLQLQCPYIGLVFHTTFIIIIIIMLSNKLKKYFILYIDFIFICQSLNPSTQIMFLQNYLYLFIYY